MNRKEQDTFEKPDDEVHSVAQNICNNGGGGNLKSSEFNQLEELNYSDCELRRFKITSPSFSKYPNGIGSANKLFTIKEDDEPSVISVRSNHSLSRDEMFSEQSSLALSSFCSPSIKENTGGNSNQTSLSYESSSPMTRSEEKTKEYDSVHFNFDNIESGASASDSVFSESTSEESKQFYLRKIGSSFLQDHNTDFSKDASLITNAIQKYKNHQFPRCITDVPSTIECPMESGCDVVQGANKENIPIQSPITTKKSNFKPHEKQTIYTKIYEIFSKMMESLGLFYHNTGDRWVKSWCNNALNLILEIEIPKNVNIVKTMSVTRKLIIKSAKLSIHKQLEDEALLYMFDKLLKDKDTVWMSENLKSIGQIRKAVDLISEDVASILQIWQALFNLDICNMYSSFLNGCYIFSVFTISRCVEFEVHVSLDHWKGGLQNLELDVVKIDGPGEIEAEEVRSIYAKITNNCGKFKQLFHDLMVYGLQN